MNILMLDTKRVEELDEIEAVRRIHAGVAVEAPLPDLLSAVRAEAARAMATDLDKTIMNLSRTAPQPPESAMLDRSRNTATKPIPQPRPAPPREKRSKRR